MSETPKLASKIFIFFDTSRVWIFEDIFVFDAILVYIACKNLGKISLVSIWFVMVITQIISRVYNDSLAALTYPPNINIWLVLQFWYPRVGALIPCIHLIYQTNTGHFLLIFCSNSDYLYAVMKQVQWPVSSTSCCSQCTLFTRFLK